MRDQTITRPLPTQDKRHIRYTYVLQVGFEFADPVFEQSKTVQALLNKLRN
jgi:hypothetical protein